MQALLSFSHPLSYLFLFFFCMAKAREMTQQTRRVAGALKAFEIALTGCHRLVI